MLKKQIADMARTWGVGWPVVHPELQAKARQFMEAEAERARMVHGLCFVLGVDHTAAEQLLDEHNVDYERLLEGGEEYERARTIVAKL